MRLYWDANCFIALLNRERTTSEQVHQALRTTFERMLRGELHIVSSRLIRKEVIQFPSSAKLEQFHADLAACPHFEAYVQNEAVTDLSDDLQRRMLDAGRALRAMDSFHLATAILAGVNEFWTTDAKLINAHAQGFITEIEVILPHIDQPPLDV